MRWQTTSSLVLFPLTIETACSTWLQMHRGPAPLGFHSTTGRQARMPSSELPHRPAATLLQPPSGGARCSKYVLWMPPPLAYSLRSARPSPFCPIHPGRTLFLLQATTSCFCRPCHIPPPAADRPFTAGTIVRSLPTAEAVQRCNDEY
ncbi:uncharacterized protein LOC119364713 isoform X4 [Triticum dicoccoides]|uniref:uncharacterized protein LOC119364713 isoform X4 n=1 Tax=Triticum dicoccoides TaxID=85692 RepID=UPI00188DF033|nr:uncharacterized protein LOC119364713 isoform X4 [Triticum dicoccoides]